MVVKLLTEHHLEFLSLKGGCRGSFKSTLVKMPHCWKSHALAHIYVFFCSIPKLILCSVDFLKWNIQDDDLDLFYCHANQE